MSTEQSTENDLQFTRRTIEAALRIALLGILLVWCFQIVKPFLIPMIWGIIIAVASYPAYLWLQSKVRGQHVLAATLYTLFLLAILIVPTIMLTETLVSSTHALAEKITLEKISIPEPPGNIITWPIIGEPLDTFWRLASTNLETALKQMAPYIKVAAKWLISLAADVGLTILQFIFAIIISGVLLVNTEKGSQMAKKIAYRLTGRRGIELLTLSENTIRSVIRGIIGVALIQSLLAGLGFLYAGIPAAGLWALLCLLLAVVQIGIAPITIPILIYLFSTADTLTAVTFLIWIIPVSLLDNFLKPILLSRGVKTPMAVIFIGAIGGFMTSGLIGLFTGAIVFSLGYDLFIFWLDQDSNTVSSQESDSASS